MSRDRDAIGATEEGVVNYADVGAVEGWKMNCVYDPLVALDHAETRALSAEQLDE